MNDFFEQIFEKSIVFTEKNGFIERSCSEKTNEIDGKLTIVLRTNKINLLMNNWKKTKWVVANYERTK